MNEHYCVTVRTENQISRNYPSIFYSSVCNALLLSCITLDTG